MMIIIRWVPWKLHLEVFIYVEKWLLNGSFFGKIIWCVCFFADQNRYASLFFRGGIVVYHLLSTNLDFL